MVDQQIYIHQFQNGVNLSELGCHYSYTLAHMLRCHLPSFTGHLKQHFLNHRNYENNKKVGGEGVGERKMKEFAEAYLELSQTSVKLFHRRCSTGL